jgi:hypothetical protein
LVAEELNLDTETVRKILIEDLEMRRVAAKIMPTAVAQCLF